MNTFVNNPPYLIAADDEKDLLTLFEVSMKAKGYKVGISTDAKNLWALLRRKLPDVLFLDIQMGGVNGGELCQQIKKKKETAGIPIVMLSANDNVEEIAKQCGADGFVHKPFKTEKILQEIERILV